MAMPKIKNMVLMIAKGLRKLDWKEVVTPLGVTTTLHPLSHPPLFSQISLLRNQPITYNL